MVGLDIGTSSSKVVQLKYLSERAVLETYGEILNENYFKEANASGSGFLRYTDSNLVELVKDIFRESKITTTDTVMSIPSTSSFITTLSFPLIPKKEIETAIPYEARKYIPISISEVILDWEIMEPEEKENKTEVLLVAVPREMIEKLKRISTAAGLNLKALEVETFSSVRSLMRRDPYPTAIVNIGHLNTSIAMVEKGKMRVSHNISRGAQEITRALEHGLGVSAEKAEEVKKETGLSSRMENREIDSVIRPLVEILFSEIERMISLQNRHSDHRLQKIILTGGGANLKGLVEYAGLKFGLESSLGNPFNRLVTPTFLQPVLKEIGPNFSVAVGLALHEISVN